MKWLNSLRHSTRLSDYLMDGICDPHIHPLSVHHSTSNFLAHNHRHLHDGAIELQLHLDFHLLSISPAHPSPARSCREWSMSNWRQWILRKSWDGKYRSHQSGQFDPLHQRIRLHWWWYRKYMRPEINVGRRGEIRKLLDWCRQDTSMVHLDPRSKDRELKSILS